MSENEKTIKKDLYEYLKSTNGINFGLDTASHKIYIYFYNKISDF